MFDTGHQGRADLVLAVPRGFVMAGYRTEGPPPTNDGSPVTYHWCVCVCIVTDYFGDIIWT